MGTLNNHKDLYLNFKNDAENTSISKQSRVELFFLSIFHLIEACAAKYRTHINKHQMVRKILETTTEIFEKQTEFAWKSFQTIETRLRPKFSYGFSWTDEDFKELRDIYKKIEKICLGVI